MYPFLFYAKGGVVDIITAVAITISLYKLYQGSSKTYIKVLLGIVIIGAYISLGICLIYSKDKELQLYGAFVCVGTLTGILISWNLLLINN